MPKRKKDYDDRISTQVTLEMKADLMTIGFLNGNGKEYGPAARMLLADAIKRFKSELPERKLKEFEEIRHNVLIMIMKKEPEGALEKAKQIEVAEHEQIQ